MPVSLGRTLPLLLLLAVPAEAQRAADRPARELLLEAGCTVLVEPVNAREPAQVRVVEVFRGTAIRPGDLLNAMPLATALAQEDAPRWSALRQAILFGEPADKVGEPFRLLPTGVRLTTRADRSWAALSQADGFRLVPHPDLDWDALVLQLRRDARDIVAVEQIREQPPSSRRSRALLDWMRRHPPARLAPVLLNPVKGRIPVNDVGETGWGDLQTAPLRWILQTGLVEDSWDALAEYARQHNGALVGRDCYPFATPEGRALLLARARDEASLEGDNLRALKMLGWPETYPSAPVRTATFARPLGEAEQRPLIEGILGFLDRPDPRWKQGAVQAAAALLAAREATPEELRKDVVRALETAYKTVKPGTTRNVLAESLFRLAPQGRPPLALLLDLDRREATLHFWLAVHPEGGVVAEVPTLRLEEVAADGKTAEILKEPLSCPSAPDWKLGWDTRRPLYAELPLRRLRTGATYRLTVTGIVGPEKKPFTSEPRTFQATGPKTPNGIWSASTGQIVLDEQ